MSKDWTKEELKAASAAMESAGHMGYEEFCNELREQEAKAMLERFYTIQRARHYACPRCGQMNMADDPIRNALSRHAQVMICDTCGTAEALGDYVGVVLPLREWSLTKAMFELTDDD